MDWKLNQPQLAKSTAIDSSLNVFENTKSLEVLFEKLYQVKTTNTIQKVIFSHIGDSHIQADKITSVLRNEFQSYFGNAGRGLIFPFQVAKTNSPTDIQSSSNEIWDKSRLSKMNADIDCGILGYGIKTDQPMAELSINLKDSLKNNFDKIDLFYTKGLKLISLKSTINENEIILDSNSQFSTIQLPKYVSNIKLKFIPIENKSITFFGASVSKNLISGVIYNAIGANGAKIIDYNNAPVFWRQLSALNTDCFVISLGTNEAQNQNLTPDLYIAQLKIMVEKIKIAAPNAAIVITSPPVSYFKKIKPNKILPLIATATKEFCYQHNLIFWDLFNISKGLFGTATWRKLKLLNTDLVHFTNAGYALQGALLSNAFAKAYNQFIIDKLN